MSITEESYNELVLELQKLKDENELLKHAIQEGLSTREGILNENSEQPLLRSENKFRMLFELSPIGMAMVDHETGEFLEVNDALLSPTGYTREEFLKLSFWDITPKEYEAQEIAQLAELNATGKFGPNEKEYIRKDGTRFPISITGSLFTDINERKVVWGIIEDISERKRTGRIIMAFAEKYKTLLDTSRDGIHLIDMNGQLIECNDTFCEMLGYQKDEILALNVRDWDAQIPDERLNQLMDEIIAKPQMFETKHKKKNGQEIIVEINATKVVIDGLFYIYSSSRDITERWKTEEALRLSEEKNSAMLRAIPDIMMVQDKNGVFTNYHAPTTSQLYSPPEVFIGKTFEEVLPIEIAKEFKPIFSKAIDSKEIQIFEYTLDFNNDKRFFEARIISFEEDKVISIIRDNTEQKRAEEKLRILTQAVEQSSASIVLTDVSGKIDYVNKKFTDISGYTLAEVIGQNSNILKTEYHEAEYYSNLWETILSGKEWHGEFYNAKKNGEHYWESAMISPVFDENGNILNFLGVKEDITEKKAAEDLLRMQENFLITLTDNLPGMVAYWTTELICTFANKVYLEWFGKTKEDMIGINIRDLLGEELYNKNKPYIDSALNGVRADFERTLIKSNGEIGYTWAHYIPNIQNDKVQGFYVLVSDVTELKESQIKLESLNKDLNELNTTKDKFFSIIAHDLKSPFSGFLGLTKLMSERIMDLSMKDLKEYSMAMQESASNLYKLLENLLEWSRMQRGVTEFNPEACNLSFIAKENVDLLSEFSNQKNIEVLNKIDDNISVSADIPMLNTIFRNLLSNAIKFTPKNGKIEIGSIYKSDEKAIEIYIKDSGIGMSEDTLKKLFKVDEKVSRLGTEGESSTGLGLLLCKEFVVKHGGVIRVESLEGLGSTFFFTLPL